MLGRRSGRPFELSRPLSDGAGTGRGGAWRLVGIDDGPADVIGHSGVQAGHDRHFIV